MLKVALRALLERRGLTSALREQAFTELLDGAPPAEAVGAFLAALQVHPYRAEDLAAWVRLARARMIPFPGQVPSAVDPCGTGGDGLGTFNISTAAALVIAAAGQPVIKHGNRGFSSPSGSSDVLEQLGVAVDVDSERMNQCFVATRFAYCHAPRYHPALRRLAEIRRNLGFRTLLNLAGPLLNPAGVEVQLIGVGSRGQQRLVAEAALLLGPRRLAVVHSADGHDELSPLCDNQVLRAVDGVLIEESWCPSHFGSPPALPTPPVQDAEGSALRIEHVLSGQAHEYEAWVTINAGAALFLAGRSKTLAEGTDLAQSTLRQGQAAGLLGKLRKLLPFKP